MSLRSLCSLHALCANLLFPSLSTVDCRLTFRYHASRMPALLRTLRERDLFLLFIGSVIGSGIFLTPGLILRQLNGSVRFSLLVWIGGGTLALLGPLTDAELAATNPEAGGLYCFIRDGFGRVSAFLYGWCLFLVI